jgi:hypothetical protein
VRASSRAFEHTARFGSGDASCAAAGYKPTGEKRWLVDFVS